jgi:response regulator RpfG family c-di-GMP phosphodiesterase
VRARRGDAYTYFILLTARAPTEENLRRADAAQIDDFLAKPLDGPALLSRLRVAGRILEYRREIGELRKLIPLCMYCKKIRDDNHYWDRMEHYLQSQGVDVTHSICPNCYETHVQPQLDELKPAESHHPKAPQDPNSPFSG